MTTSKRANDSCSPEWKAKFQELTLVGQDLEEATVVFEQNDVFRLCHVLEYVAESYDSDWDEPGSVVFDAFDCIAIVKSQLSDHAIAAIDSDLQRIRSIRCLYRGNPWLTDATPNISCEVDE